MIVDYRIGHIAALMSTMRNDFKKGDGVVRAPEHFAYKRPQLNPADGNIGNAAKNMFLHSDNEAAKIDRLIRSEGRVPLTVCFYILFKKKYILKYK